MTGPGNPPPALVVSLHDVSPLTWRASRAVLEQLVDLGVNCASLLVVPDHHHRGHFKENNEFCSWLRAQEGAGHEIVIHGYYHQRAGQAGERVRDRFITRIYTAGEGEFYDLSQAAAADLVQRAQQEFKDAGLHPCGFIAPAWLLSPGAKDALPGTGCRYTTTLGGVYDLRTGRSIRSQSLVYSVRSRLRSVISLGWNRFLFARLASNALLRFSIHPVDFEHPAVWRQIRRLISRSLEERRPFTYQGWLNARAGAFDR